MAALLFSYNDCKSKRTAGAVIVSEQSKGIDSKIKKNKNTERNYVGAIFIFIENKGMSYSKITETKTNHKEDDVLSLF